MLCVSILTTKRMMKMCNPSFMPRALLAASYGLVCLVIFSKDVVFAQTPAQPQTNCNSTRECAQQSVDAAYQAKAAVANMRKQLGELHSRIETSPSISCILKWENPA